MFPSDSLGHSLVDVYHFFLENKINYEYVVQCTCLSSCLVASPFSTPIMHALMYKSMSMFVGSKFFKTISRPSTCSFGLTYVLLMPCSMSVPRSKCLPNASKTNIVRAYCLPRYICQIWIKYIIYPIFFFFKKMFALCTSSRIYS